MIKVIKLSNIKTGYKVVRKTFDNQLKSCWIYSNVLIYTLGKRTYHEIFDGKLCVFSTLKKAIKFIYDVGGSKFYIIYRCKYRKFKHDKQYDNSFYVYRMYYDDFMHKFQLKYCTDILPKGTKLASWVKLTEKVIIND